MTASLLHKTLVKKYFVTLFCACFSGLLVFCALSYIIDPVQLFHKSWFMPQNMLAANMRFQAPGLIRHYDFDSIILGSSVLENTSASEAGKKLGGKFLNLSISGSDFFERSFPLRLALQQKPLQNVIYSLDAFAYFEQPMGEDASPQDWTFLYDDNLVNDLLFYGTKKNLINFFTSDKGLKKINPDCPGAWFNDSFHAARFGGLDNWIKNLNNPQVKNFLLNELPYVADIAQNDMPPIYIGHDGLSKAQEYIDKYFLDYVKKYPSTMFYCVFPPYYRYYFAKMLKISPHKYNIYQDIQRYMVNKSKEYKNLKIFGFEDQDFLDDIANYKDVSHFGKNYNSLIIDGIHNDATLNPGNIEEYLARSLNKAQNFDMAELNNRAQKLIKSRDLSL